VASITMFASSVFFAPCARLKFFQVFKILTGPQKALLGTGFALIPPACGLAIPGGLVGGSVSLEFNDIFFATLPWSLSIAAIAWLWLAWNKSEKVKLGASAAILAVGAAFALVMTPHFEVSAEKADDPIYYVAAHSHSQVAVVQGGRVISHNPRAAGLAAVVGVTVFIAFAYALLYGFPLWLAGIACGAYLGYLFHNALTASAKPPPIGGG